MWLKDRAGTVSRALTLVPFAGIAFLWFIGVVPDRAIKMAGVFMISLSTIWVRTGVMPRWLAFLSYVLALLRVSLASNLWVTLIFPVWVLLVSLYVLVSNLRSPSALGIQP
jgi:hypothetical protein